MATSQTKYVKYISFIWFLLGDGPEMDATLSLLLLLLLLLLLFQTSSIVQVIKSRRMRWAGHVARMRERGGVYGIWWGNLRERAHWGDLSVDGRIILRWIFRKWDVGVWTGSI
jgi:hypothetical protein